VTIVSPIACLQYHSTNPHHTHSTDTTHTPQTPHTLHRHPTHPTPGGPGWPQGFFEIKFEITVSRRQILRKSFSRMEKSVFELNDLIQLFFFFTKNILNWNAPLHSIDSKGCSFQTSIKEIRKRIFLRGGRGNYFNDEANWKYHTNVKYFSNQKKLPKQLVNRYIIMVFLLVWSDYIFVLNFVNF